MKILLSSYACEPGQGSEPGIGWNVAREIAKYYQVWVLTSNTHRSAIEAELNHTPVSNLHFVYFDPLGWTIDWKGKPQGVQLHYYLWQIETYFVARSLHQHFEFDFLHHVTYGRYWGPSFLVLLPVAFLWGPVAGGESAPRAFWQDFSIRGKVYETLRDIARWIGERDPFVQLTARRSVMALASTEETAARLRQIKAKNVQIFSNVGLPKEDIDRLMKCGVSSPSPLRFISIGRLLHWKGINLGLEAFAIAKIEKAEYWIVGDGPERQRLETLAKKLEIADKVRFWGTIPRDELLSKLEECHVLVHPSLHDSGGWVCSEMMAAGRPVICLDLGGPAVQVTEETGFKIPAHTPKQAAQDLAEAMVRLDDSELRRRMGEAGQKRVKEAYSWETKGQILVQLYK